MLRDTRDIYRPFEYPEFEEIHAKLTEGFWHKGEVQLGDDVIDYKHKMTEDERQIINKILKNFVQSEIHVGNFWGDCIADWFKKPEIQNVARFISGNETIHSTAYDLLNSTLGLQDYDKLKEDKDLNARIEMLMNKKAKNNKDILKQIFLYSVMGEGVSLFSSFIIILSFSRKNLLKSIGQIIAWSSVDEQCHSDVGCLLFNIFKKEYGLIDDEMKESLYEIAKMVIDVEHKLIDRVFEGSTTDVISKDAVKNYIHDRANKQLKKVGLKKLFKINKDLLKETEFFDITVHGSSVLDFFSSKESNYSKGLINIEEGWQNND